MLERLPTPWGLVRLGVAPDHPKIKAVSKAFERIAAQPGFRFLGGVEVGRDLTHDDLAELYDAVVYAVGAQTDRRMGIPGEDLPGSWAATEFVAWYNGHPDYQELAFDLSGERAVVVGARQRRARRRAHARARAGGDPPDGHDRRGDRGDPRLRPRGDRPARPPRTGAGGIHDAGAEGARRARRRRRDRRSGRARARSCERGVARARHQRAPQRRGAARVRAAARSGEAARDPAALLRLAGRDPRRRVGSRGSRSSATGSSPTSLDA